MPSNKKGIVSSVAEVKQKIFTLEELSPKITELKKAGKKVVFTNGCFDLIHVGHTRYLREAARAGDIMVIGVNSDKSVKGLKGDLRPLIPEAERMEILANLFFVDFVVLFEESTPYNLIKELIPDRLVKGGDWPIDQVVGKDIVEENGGKVFTIPEIPQASTSNIIDLVLSRYTEK